MLKIRNSFKIKGFVRVCLVVVIAIELIEILLALWKYFYDLVILGYSTSSYKTEGNILVRLINFFEIGIGSTIRDYIVNLCIPLALYFMLRDRDREVLYGENELHDLTDAVKEGIIEGVEEVSHNDNASSNTKQDEESDSEKKNKDTLNKDDFFEPLG